MEEKDPRTRRRRPRVADQLVVLLMSVGIGLLVMLVGISAGRRVELVLWLITAFAVVTINVLFAFSQWESKTQTSIRRTTDSSSCGYLSLEAEERASQEKEDNHREFL